MVPGGVRGGGRGKPLAQVGPRTALRLRNLRFPLSQTRLTHPLNSQLFSPPDSPPLRAPDPEKPSILRVLDKYFSNLHLSSAPPPSQLSLGSHRPPPSRKALPDVGQRAVPKPGPRGPWSRYSRPRRPPSRRTAQWRRPSRPPPADLLKLRSRWTGPEGPWPKRQGGSAALGCCEGPPSSSPFSPAVRGGRRSRIWKQPLQALPRSNSGATSAAPPAAARAPGIPPPPVPLPRRHPYATAGSKLSSP